MAAAGDPDRIGDYQVVGRLGAGDQAVVYLAVSPAGMLCTVKVLRTAWASADRARRRLAQDAAAARRVAPFCTAAVREVRIDGPQPYIVTEYVPGSSLADHVARGGPLSGGELQAVAVAMATALMAIHRAGVVHRNLKPSNVLLTRTGVKVIDFGIAQAEAVPETLTAPAYLAPEQAQGGGVGAAADMFAWAATVAFAATGRPPFGTGSPPAVLLRVTSTDPELDGVPQPLAGLLSRCLAKDPVRRPEPAAVLLDLLGASVPVGADPVALLVRGASVSSAATFRGLEVPTGSMAARTLSPRPPSPPATPKALPTGPLSAGAAVATTPGRSSRPPSPGLRERVRREVRNARIVLGIGATATAVGVPSGIWAVSVQRYVLAMIAFGSGPLLTIIAVDRFRRVEAPPPAAGPGSDRAARATLTRVAETDGSHQERQLLRFEGWTRIDGGPPQRVIVEDVPPSHVVEEARRKGTVPVLVDPRDPARMVLDWDQLQAEVAAGVIRE